MARSKTITFSETITINDEELETTVEAYFTPRTRGVHTLRNGDPGYPDDPAEAEITSVMDNATKTDVLNCLTESQVEDLQNKAIEQGEEPDDYPD